MYRIDSIAARQTSKVDLVGSIEVAGSDTERKGVVAALEAQSCGESVPTAKYRKLTLPGTCLYERKTSCEYVLHHGKGCIPTFDSTSAASYHSLQAEGTRICNSTYF